MREIGLLHARLHHLTRERAGATVNHNNHCCQAKISFCHFRSLSAQNTRHPLSLFLSRSHAPQTLRLTKKEDRKPRKCRRKLFRRRRR